MSQVHCDPESLREFAASVGDVSRSIVGELGQLRSRLDALGVVWDDESRSRYADEFEGAAATLRSSLSALSAQQGRLLTLSRALENIGLSPGGFTSRPAKARTRDAARAHAGHGAWPIEADGDSVAIGTAWFAGRQVEWEAGSDDSKDIRIALDAGRARVVSGAISLRNALASSVAVRASIEVVPPSAHDLATAARNVRDNNPRVGDRRVLQQYLDAAQLPTARRASSLANALPWATVTWSVKELDSVIEKLRGRTVDGRLRYSSPDQMWDVSRAEALVAPGEVQRSIAAILSLEPDCEAPIPLSRGLYRGTHIRFRRDGRRFEVQIHTPAQHTFWAWSHRAMYKGPLRDDPSAQDFEIAYARWLYSGESGVNLPRPVWPAALPSRYNPFRDGRS